MNILAIETSCDETAVAIISAKGNPKEGGVSFDVLSNLVLSQVKLHAEYGGVYPSLAKREHTKNLIPLLRQALVESNFLNVKIKKKNEKLNAQRSTLNALFEREPELLKQFLEFIPTIKKPDIDAIAVTYGPGLEPALWVGINFAKTLSLVWNVPVIPVNHMEGHVFSALLHREEISNFQFLISKQTQNSKFKIQNFKFPILALLISGGHTELVLSKDWLQYEIVGETRDDAVGEAFDKVARMLGLPYPGGPHIARLAQSARKHADKTQKNAENFPRLSASGLRKSAGRLRLPRPMIDSGDFDFSFSGIKTAVLYRLKKIKKLTPLLVQEFSYEFEEAVTEVIVKKTIAAVEEYGAQTIIVGGGVSANERIHNALVGESRIKNQELRIFFPAQELTTDNALMIAVAGYIRNALRPTTDDPQHITARGNLRLSNM